MLCNISLQSSAMRDARDALHGLTASALAELTETHVTTARRWLRRHSAPRAILMALALLRFGDLGAISPEWDGWTVRDGQLWSPEGTSYTPGMVRAGPLHERAAAEYRAQVVGALQGAESPPERRERVEALTALVNAHAAARAALETLSAGLTAAEADRLFNSLESTRERRARADAYHQSLKE